MILKWEERARIYDFRHTALIGLYQSGAGTFAVMKIAGHKDAGTTRRYINLPEDHQREAMARLDAFNMQSSAQVNPEANQTERTTGKKSIAAM